MATNSRTQNDPATQGEASTTEAAATESYTVAPGCTVGGKGPGESIDLDANDAKRFRDLGFILDEDGQRRYMSDGPAVNKEDGVEIKPKA